jgi:hypothetical protein
MVDIQNCVIMLPPLSAKKITFSFGFRGKKQQNAVFLRTVGGHL